MPEDACRPAQAVIRTELGAIFVSLELSRRTRLVTSLSSGCGEKMSKHARPGSGSDLAGLVGGSRSSGLRRSKCHITPPRLRVRACRL